MILQLSSLKIAGNSPFRMQFVECHLTGSTSTALGGLSFYGPEYIPPAVTVVAASLIVRGLRGVAGQKGAPYQRGWRPKSYDKLSGEPAASCLTSLLMQTLLELVRATRCGLNRAQRRLVGRLGNSKAAWQGALSDELKFWENALMDNGRHWNPESFRKRTDPQLELQKELQELIPASPRTIVRILDVGAGPLTRIGKNWPGHELEIVAVDPLAEAYGAILDKLSIGLR